MAHGSGLKDMLTPITEAVEGLKSDMAVHTEILKRVEDKVTKTNGKVAEIEYWRIEHSTQHSALKWVVAMFLIPVVLILVKEFVSITVANIL